MQNACTVCAAGAASEHRYGAGATGQYRDPGQALREQLMRQHGHQLQLLNGELRHVQAQCTANQETLVLLNRDYEALIR
ncbi:hypothetical protein PS726_01870 [Pseudomonas fluorescens]|nr:hypothetical protein PS647_01267 [Pseudomonas fluorescens]VVN90887.1 hypothetical protein PS726_01870 [Pseudomonas fluorescens]VVO57065.1 hypothetical protein PS843_00583 [Pseudomonas fluorescens]